MKLAPPEKLFEQFVSTTRAGTFSPVYLIFGEEQFFVQQAVDVLIRESLDPSSHSFNLDIMYGGEASARDIAERASSFPMIGDRRLVVVRDFERLAERKSLVSYVKRPSPTTILVLAGRSPDFRLKDVQAIRENATVLDFRELNESAVKEWTKTRAESKRKRLDEEACDVLIEYVGRSLTEIENALQKVVLYVGDRTNIGTDDVQAVIGQTRESDVFELQRCLVLRDHAKVMSVLFRMLDSGESAIGIIVMLARFFQKLWSVPDIRSSGKDGLLAQKLGVAVFALKDYVRGAAVYSREEIERSFFALRDADEGLKTSAGDQKLVMTILCSKIVAGG